MELFLEILIFENHYPKGPEDVVQGYIYHDQ